MSKSLLVLLEAMLLVSGANAFAHTEPARLEVSIPASAGVSYSCDSINGTVSRSAWNFVLMYGTDGELGGHSVGAPVGDALTVQGDRLMISNTRVRRSSLLLGTIGSVPDRCNDDTSSVSPEFTLNPDIELTSNVAPLTGSCTKDFRTKWVRQLQITTVFAGTSESFRFTSTWEEAAYPYPAKSYGTQAECEAAPVAECFLKNKPCDE